MCLKRGWSAILDGKDYLIASTDRLSNPFIQRIEGSPRMNEAVQAIILPYKDTSVESVVDSIPRFDLRAVTW